MEFRYLLGKMKNKKVEGKAQIRIQVVVVST
jgi:hypothetical protein